MDLYKDKKKLKDLAGPAALVECHSCQMGSCEVTMALLRCYQSAQKGMSVGQSVSPWTNNFGKRHCRLKGSPTRLQQSPHSQVLPLAL